MQKGILNIVGIGSGEKETMTLKAYKTLENSDIIIGYKKYIDYVKEIFPDKQYISNGMGSEIERCKICIEYAETGKDVSIVSSGDSGIYGMAGIILEIAESSINVNIISGVTSSIEAASALGAPIMNDFVVVSMSDIMTPIKKIFKRIEYASKGDYVICIYNPKSNKRKNNIKDAFKIIEKIQGKDIIIGIVKNAGRNNQKIFLTTIQNINYDDIDMDSIVIVGNTDTYIKNGKMITKRGYNI